MNWKKNFCLLFPFPYQTFIANTFFACRNKCGTRKETKWTFLKEKQSLQILTNFEFSCFHDYVLKNRLEANVNIHFKKMNKYYRLFFKTSQSRNLSSIILKILLGWYFRKLTTLAVTLHYFFTCFSHKLPHVILLCILS